MLWQRQQKLERLELFSNYTPSTDHGATVEDIDLVAELARHDFQKLQAVRVVPDGEDVGFLASAALQCGVVTDFEVDGRLWSGEEAVLHEVTGRAIDPLTASLFSHLPHAQPGMIPRNDFLVKLALKDIDLTLSKYTWHTYLHLVGLRHLSLEHCKGADIFLMKMTAGVHLLGLRSFTLLHELSTQADRTIHAVEELLSFPRNTLQLLVLVLRNAPHLPKASAIRGHGRTLRKLLVDIKSGVAVNNNTWNNGNTNTGVHLVYEIGQFQSIMQSCIALRELGIALPNVEFDYEILSRDCGNFSTYLDIIAGNLKLATLSILTWPSLYQDGQSPGYYQARDPQLASDIFARHRSYDDETDAFVVKEKKCNLEVVGFGVRERHVYGTLPRYFMQAEVTVLGKKRATAERVALKDLRDWKLDIAVLDYEKRDFDENSRKSFHSYKSSQDEPEIMGSGW